MSIAKIIHYCWFGEHPKSELAIKCIESWKRYCPSYEIKEWNESNYNIEKNDYVREAYRAGKWSFVSDYVRFDILYQQGGIYFDTDVELIKSIDDIVAKGAFMGLEAGDKVLLAPGLGMAAYPRMEIFREILDYYETIHFIKNENGGYQTVVNIVTEIFMKHGTINNDQLSVISGVNIYPSNYFCPLNYYTGESKITPNTYSIHHYAATWVSEEIKKMFEVRKRIAGKNWLICLIGNCVIIQLHFVDIIKRRGIYGTISWTLKQVKEFLGGGKRTL